MAGHGRALDRSVLVLNSLYQAVQITGVRRAFQLFCGGRARALSGDFVSYSFENWCALPIEPGHDVIRTPTRHIRVPPVIQLVYYDRLPRREVRFTRRNVFYRDKNRCQYCRRLFLQRDLNLDHVMPISRGGGSGWDNVVTACIPCNSRKGDRTPAEAGMRLMRRPKKPAGHPVLRANWLRSFREEWKAFLDEAYWNVELGDDWVQATD
jgi:5-methylcytosine-specific restriction endonuclease McrA